jgi:type I restriction enzyme S subunit
MSELPPGWEYRRIDQVGDVQLGRQRSPAMMTGPYMKPYLRVANVLDGYIDYSDVLEMNFAPHEAETFGLLPGDILLNEGQDLDLVGRCAIFNGPPGMCFQNTLLRFRSRTVFTKFAAAVFKHWLHRGEFRRLTRQTTSIAHIGAGQFSGMLFPLAPLHEQHLIAAILDSVDEKIQTAMRLLAKQRELRVASIRQLVADGLACFDGIEASELNRGTRHSNGSWSLVPLGSVLEGIDAGHSPDLEDTPAGPGQWGVLKVSAVGEDGFRPVENKVVRNRGLYDPAICVRPGDLLMTRANTSQLVGRSCIVENTPPSLMLCDKTLRLRVDERSVPTRYIQIILGLAEVRRQIEIAATGTSGSMKNISQQSIRQLMIPLGSPEGVRLVVEIDILHEAQTSALRREVEGLRFLKLGLMDDLLTGQVRVPAG